MWHTPQAAVHSPSSTDAPTPPRQHCLFKNPKANSAADLPCAWTGTGLLTIAGGCPAGRSSAGERHSGDQVVGKGGGEVRVSLYPDDQEDEEAHDLHAQAIVMMVNITKSTLQV